MPCNQHGISSYKSKKIEKVIQKPLFCLSESLRSMKNLHLVFLSRSEARKNSIWSFWVAQKHEKNPFGLSESLRSTKKLYLVFLSRSEARKNSIWPFWVAQKHEKSPFGLSESLRSIEIYFFHTYVVDRNDYFQFLAFLKRSEAWKTSICSFWNVQKHKKPPFGLSETFRSTKTRKLFARLPYNLYFCMQMKIYLT